MPGAVSAWFDFQFTAHHNLKACLLHTRVVSPSNGALFLRPQLLHKEHPSLDWLLSLECQQPSSGTFGDIGQHLQHDLLKVSATSPHRMSLPVTLGMLQSLDNQGQQGCRGQRSKQAPSQAIYGSTVYMSR